ncbi:hypothetical protein SNE40_018296 [Patella caerulea]|uniref:Uncharacterized protein n=1 Tax=Patella caerulea TaxID=87958 RepID=A0AAN8J7D4_PATCE
MVLSCDSDLNVKLNKIMNLTTNFDIRLQHIEQKVIKIDEVHSILSAVSTIIQDLEIQVNSIVKKNHELAERTSTLHQSNNELLRKSEKADAKLDILSKQVDADSDGQQLILQKIKALAYKQEEMSATLTDLQCRSMK